MVQPVPAESNRVAVVGGGLSGLTAANVLRDAGSNVVVFDKGRRPGGRSNTREHDAHRFDHGAQFFTVRDERVRPLLNAWVDSGVAAPWGGRLIRVEGSTIQPAKPSTRYVGVPGMIDIARSLASTVKVRVGVRIKSLTRLDHTWIAVDSEGETHAPFDRVVVAVPAPQAVTLLSEVPHLQAAAAAIEMAPIWAAMLVFEGPLPLEFDGAFVADGPISWMARDSSKPSRPEGEAWVLHATPEWTRDHWNIDRLDIPALLLTALEDRWGPMPPVIFKRAHRWGFALAGDTTPAHPIFDAESGLGVCGDWCAGGRIEGAILSGIEIAHLLVD